MGQVLHGSATTTEAVRRAIQHSQESLRVLAKRYGINPKTVAKWKKRTSVGDVPTGPKNPTSTVLTIEEEAVIVAFRQYTLLPLDDCLYALQPTIPSLTRSSLHRCLQRHGISRLPEIEGEKPAKTRFKSYPIGYFHIDIAEIQTAEGKLYLYVGIDRTSKFAFTRTGSDVIHRGDTLERIAMAAPIELRTDYDAEQLRDLARSSSEPGQVRRLLAISVINAGEARSTAAAIGGVGLQTVRDWVLRFNAEGPAGL
jgi:transposase